MKRKTLIISIAAAAAFTATALVHSEEQEQDHKMATGIMLGQTRSNYDSGSYSGTPVAKDTSGGLFFEYDFARHFGMQATWWLLALHNPSDVTVGSTTYTGITREVSGFALDGVGLLPLGHGFKLMGKAGAFLWSGRTSGCDDFLCNSFQGTTLNNDTGVSFASQ